MHSKMATDMLPPLPTEDLRRAHDMLSEQTWRELSGRRIFVTGGTGFVGKWLLATLLNADRRLDLGCRVCVLSRDPAAFLSTAPHLAAARGVELLQGDVRDFVFPGGRFDTVIHAATDVVAQCPPETTFLTCIEGTRRVLDFACQADAKDLLLVSSGAVYGRQPPELTRVPETHTGAPDPLLPSSAYGEGKRAAEWLACVAGSTSVLQTKIARCFAFVGPYLPLDKQFAIGNFLKAALAGDEILIQGDGTPHRSYLYAADMAAWLWAVLLRGKSCVAYNVGADESLSIADLAQRVCQVLNASSRIRTLKAALAETLPERYVPDVDRARAELGLPEPMPLGEAIARTAQWHRQLATHKECIQ